MLSEHFDLSEFTKSPTAIRRGIDNTPSSQVVANLKLVCDHILEPLRAHFEKPIKVNSGYRSPELNVAVGGSKTSSHCLGEAVDLEIMGVSNHEVAKWIADNCPYDQIILEGFSAGDPNSGWVHASYRASGNRFQKLTATFHGGKASYEAGFNV